MMPTLADNFGRVELADEALFDHELCKGGETPVFLQAAVIVELAAVFGHIEAMQELFTAARAFQRVAQRRTLIVVVVV